MTVGVTLEALGYPSPYVFWTRSTLQCPTYSRPSRRIIGVGIQVVLAGCANVDMLPLPAVIFVASVEEPQIPEVLENPLPLITLPP